MTKKVFVFVLTIVAVCVGLFTLTAEKVSAPSLGLKQEISQDDNTQEAAYKNSNVDLPTYLNQHISELSPVQETLGGTFYVTDVEAHSNTGTVRFSDGHNQYTASFNYTQNVRSGFTITKFKLLQ